MGYIRHHAIIVTSFDEEPINRAHQEAVQVFGSARVSEVLHAPVNGYLSFLVGPDGSKEGWKDSDEGDAHRDAFVAALSDHHVRTVWAEVQYGDENGDQRVLRSDTAPLGSDEDGDYV